ncbi:MAG TPA: hypothetical protein VFK05_08320 [Polyangiaceae bacterium]|nr:hypothetical protein [Polyangiaceae bacterium]
MQDWARAHAKLETISTKDLPKGGKTDDVIDPIACAGQDPQLRVLWGTSEEQPEGWIRSSARSRGGSGSGHSHRQRADVQVLAASGKRRFESIDLNEALYATGWDRTVVITGRTDGRTACKRTDNGPSSPTPSSAVKPERTAFNGC